MNNKEVSSKIVSEIVNDVKGVNSKVSSAQSKINLLHPQNDNDKKVILGGIILIILIIIGTIIIFFISSNKKYNNKLEKNKNMYDEAYENIKFKENKKLDKLYCTKEFLSQKKNIDTKRVEIYYFSKDQLVSTIFHTYITLEENYMDYYDLMIDSYSKTLEEDYNYSNVKTDLLSKDNKMLVTIFVNNNTTDANAYKISGFTKYEDAKKALIDSGFVCK